MQSFKIFGEKENCAPAADARGATRGGLARKDGDAGFLNMFKGACHLPPNRGCPRR